MDRLNKPLADGRVDVRHKLWDVVRGQDLGGEAQAVPRVSDLDALMASTQGKIEIEISWGPTIQPLQLAVPAPATSARPTRPC